MFSHEVVELLSVLGRVYVVGDSVRDALLRLPSKDLDIEVFGTSWEELVTKASKFGSVKTVGKSFGVAKLQHPTLGEIDLSLPRRENRIGVGHKGFHVVPDSSLTLAQAASRRDFTINAMLWGLDGRLPSYLVCGLALSNYQPIGVSFIQRLYGAYSFLFLTR